MYMYMYVLMYNTIMCVFIHKVSITICTLYMYVYGEMFHLGYNFSLNTFGNVCLCDSVNATRDKNQLN